MSNADFASVSLVVTYEFNTVDLGVSSTAGVIEILALEEVGFPGSVKVGSSLYDSTPSISSQHSRLNIKFLASAVKMSTGIYIGVQ